MAHILQGQDNDPSNSYVIDIYTHINNILVDPAELSFQVFDISTDAKRDTFYNANKDDVQIYPTTPGNKEYVNVVSLTTDDPPGQKIGLGHFYAPWTCPTATETGPHMVVWYFKRLVSTTVRTFKEEFLVYHSTATSQSITAGPCGYSIGEEQIRRYLRDKVSKNILLDDLDYSVDEISQAICMTVDRFNTMPVLTNYTNLNFPSKYLMLIGTSAHLLEHNAWEQLRNQLSYNDGNIHMGIHDKHQLYLAAARTLWQDWEKLSRQVKNAINLDGAWGDVSSPYITAGDDYGSIR